MKVKSIALAIISLIAVLSLSVLFNREVTAQQIPELAWKCLPPPLYGKNLDIKNSELLEGITEYDDRTYLIVRMQYEDISIFADDTELQTYVGRFALKLFGNDCFNLSDPRTAVDFIFQSRIIPGLPEPVAKEIALQFWRKKLELGNGDKESLKAILLEPPSAEGGVAVIHLEDQWALKQLGIDVPLSIPNVAPISSEARFQDEYGDQKKKSLLSKDLFDQEMQLFEELEKMGD